MFQELSLASFRHGLTAAGPLIAALTPITGSEWESAVGAIMTLIGFGLSVGRKIVNKPRAV